VLLLFKSSTLGDELHLGCSLQIVKATLPLPTRDPRPSDMHCYYDETVQLPKPSYHYNGNCHIVSTQLSSPQQSFTLKPEESKCSLGHKKPKAKHIQSTVNRQVENRGADNKKRLASTHH
jgi:hypothetical protein